MSDRRRCEATTRAGRPCKMAPLHGSRFCWAHDPATRPAAAKARRRGGRVRQGAREGEDPAPVDLEGPDAALRVLEVAIGAEMALVNSSKRNRTLGYLCGMALKALEAAELEERVEALERRFEMIGGGAR